MKTEITTVAVIGAGIVGVSCALWLQKKEFKVLLIDRNQPGSLTSSGNACAIADYGCIPVNSPNLIKRLPWLLFNKNSPLFLNPNYAITHLPWLLSFLNHCRPSKVQHTINSLGRILEHAYSGFGPLVELSNSKKLIAQNGTMYVYETEKAFENARASNQARADQGIPFRELDRDEIYDLEPNLTKRFSKGIIFENARNVLNPLTLVTNYFNHFVAHKGTLISSHAKHIDNSDSGLVVHLENDKTIVADKAVIACGAFSKQISGCGTEKLPLDTERGYHVQYAGLQELAERPISWPDYGFYVTPMDEGLRFAGTVEIAGLSSSHNKNRINYLTRKSKEMFDLKIDPDSTWLGFRPTLPDALPVIGPSPESENIFYAFGHQHIGLTLAGITGKIISELIAGETTSIDIANFSPKRFY